MRGEIIDSVPRFYNSIEKRSLKSCGFTVSRFKYVMFMCHVLADKRERDNNKEEKTKSIK